MNYPPVNSVIYVTRLIIFIEVEKNRRFMNLERFQWMENYEKVAPIWLFVCKLKKICSL